MFKFITDEELKELHERFPKGTRVELVSGLEDQWNKKVVPGCKGTVSHIDTTGTIFVHWDCGSGLGVVWGVDEIKPI